MAQNTNVYVIAAGFGDVLKIGVAKNVERRVASLQSGNPKQLITVWATEFDDRQTALEVERRAHATLDGFRLHGEWFACSDDVAIEAIVRAAESIPGLIP